MPARKPQTPKPLEDPAEYQRFVEAARALGADESPDALDRAFERVTRPAKSVISEPTHSRDPSGRG